MSEALREFRKWFDKMQRMSLAQREATVSRIKGWYWRPLSGEWQGPHPTREGAVVSAQSAGGPFQYGCNCPPDPGAYVQHQDAAEMAEDILCEMRFWGEWTPDQSGESLIDDIDEADADLHRVLADWARRHIRVDWVSITVEGGMSGGVGRWGDDS